MDKESLKIIQDKIVDILNNTNIPIYDKIELLINLTHFLDPNHYEDNIKILRKERDNNDK